MYPSQAKSRIHFLRLLSPREERHGTELTPYTALQCFANLRLTGISAKHCEQKYKICVVRKKVTMENVVCTE